MQNLATRSTILKSGTGSVRRPLRLTDGFTSSTDDPVIAAPKTGQAPDGGAEGMMVFAPITFAGSTPQSRSRMLTNQGFSAN